MLMLITKAWDIIEKLIEFIIFKLLKMRISEEKWNAFLQFVKFGRVGVSNTVISYLIYVVVLKFCEKFGLIPQSDYILAQIISFFLSVLWSFYWNRKFVFQADDNTSFIKSLLKTYMSYAFTGIFLSNILLIIWIKYMGISKIIAPIFNLVISVPINFILNKFWAFKK